jgi:hypothetical protein
VNGSQEMVDGFVHPVEIHRPIPDVLHGAGAGR